MNPGDFVDVHFPDGCKIGKLLNIYDDRCVIMFDNSVVDVPIDMVTLWVSV